MENALKDWTAERIDALLRSGEAVRLGMGSRRACYALPGSGLCVKCYRSDEEIAEGKHPERPPFKLLSASVVKEIRRCRFDEKRNTCCQEYEYWKELQGRLPEKLAGVFPSTMKKMLLPSRGWCVVEELMENADGTPPKKLFKAFWLAEPQVRSEISVAMDRLADDIVRFAVRVYDPQNLLVQKDVGGGFRIRIADFEPMSRTFISLDRIFPFVVRMKLRRRFARYRKAFCIGSW
jgi:hypothetical protein